MRRANKTNPITKSARNPIKSNITIPLEKISNLNNNFQKSNISTPRKNNFNDSNNYNEQSDTKKIQQNPETEIRKNEIIKIKVNLQKIQDLVHNFAQSNLSSIIYESKFVKEIDSIVKQFKFFQRITYEFFHQLYDLNTPKPLIETTNLRNVIASFLDGLKNFNNIIKYIKEDGLASLFNYISIKIQKIDNIITEITTKNRKGSVHVEALEDKGGSLCVLIYNIRESIQDLLLDTDVQAMDSSIIDMYINNIKGFLRLYNDAHYKEFPKSGFMQSELAQFKNDVMATCNDVIEALRAAFTLHPDLDQIKTDLDEIVSSIQNIIDIIDLPEVLSETYTEIIKKPKSKDDKKITRIYSGDLTKVRDFINSGNNRDASTIDPERSIVACTKLEIFIDNLEKIMKIKPPVKENKNPNCNNISIWDRLDNITNQFLQKMNLIDRRVDIYHHYQMEMENQGKELSEMLENSHEKNRQFDKMKHELSGQINFLNQKIQQLEKENEDNKKEIEKKEAIISQLRRYRENDISATTLNQFGKKMSDLLVKELDSNIEKNMMDNDVTNVDKCNVFVLEKRCPKCIQYENMRKNIITILKEANDDDTTIIDSIEKLKNEIIALRSENIRLKNENSQYMIDIQNLRRTIINTIRKIEKGLSKPLSSFDNTTTVVDLCNNTVNAFDELQVHHQDELKKLEANLNAKYNSELFEISNQMNQLCNENPTISNSPTSINKSPVKLVNYKKLIQEKIRRTAVRIRETETEVKLAKDMLLTIEKWMLEKAEIEFDHTPIYQSLTMLMDIIDKKPNPLEPIVNRLENQLCLMTRRVTQIAPVIFRMTSQTGVYHLEKMELFEVLNAIHMESNKLEEIFDGNRKTINEQKQLIDDCSHVLVKIGKKMSHLLMQEEANIESMKPDELMLHCLTTVEDVSNPKSRLFISIADVNRMTRKIRKNARIPVSQDPEFYLPQLDGKIQKFRKTVNLIQNLQPMLINIFKNFDFKMESVDPESQPFINLREQIFQMHNSLIRTKEDEVLVTVMDVVQRFVTLCALFLSCLAASSYGSLSLEEKENIREQYSQETVGKFFFKF